MIVSVGKTLMELICRSFLSNRPRAFRNKLSIRDKGTITELYESLLHAGAKQEEKGRVSMIY